MEALAQLRAGLHRRQLVRAVERSRSNSRDAQAQRRGGGRRSSQARASERGRRALSGGDAADGRCGRRLSGAAVLADTAERARAADGCRFLACGGHAALDECGAEHDRDVRASVLHRRGDLGRRGRAGEPGGRAAEDAAPCRTGIMPAPLRMP